MHKLFAVVFTLTFSVLSFARVTSDEIKTLSLKLKGGEYSGTYLNQPCTVFVIDNGGDGSGYFVRVTTSYGSRNFSADFGVTPDQNGQVSDLGADSIGVNFIQSLSVVRKPDSSLYVRVSNEVSGENARGYCVISTEKRD